MTKLSAMFRATALAALVIAHPLAAECAIIGSFAHRTRSEGVRTVHGNSDNLFFTSSLAVNTDGAPNSYHPDDPGGSLGKAINTICNGANAYPRAGVKIDYSRCSDLIAAFRTARSNGFPTNTYPRMEFYAVATKTGRPCIVPSGPWEGYFVSTTSLLADAGKDVCDPARYLDSLSIPFTIYPNSANFTSRGVQKGTIVVTLNPANGQLEYAIVGDRGPRWGLAEGSVFLARMLARSERTPRTRRDTYSFAVPKVHTLMLPQARIAPPYTLEKIRAEGAAAFERWGGRARLDECVATLGRRI